MTRGTWTRRIGLTVVAATAVTALAVPAGAQAATATSTSAVAAAAADVDYATWQTDCQAVMDQALPYLKNRIAAAGSGEKQAIVLDIDNTTLETDFGFSYPQPANKPVLDVAKYAQEHGVSLFFVTARPGIIKAVTDYNLKHVGYQVSGLYVRGFLDLFKDVAAYKTAQRADIENKGYTIIANIGNSATDLSGGHAEKTFKLPDYDGQLS
ncbi:HAD family acid phosphatase [Streptomyces acidiscabies]|uniref:HAD family acid phosphatase n=1 Tax=Streptomyces acidiscabies TaxID=42234 RepID=A0AAP6EJ57_9ACTN|nr:HAD family acid phosphatase [Streptomyces acidiscabies]MBP5937795.1 hydrolase [Streptomyces sp. LBUM 1476]MBZ3914091.1 hydrolase [Streptomyces acidiscabies]MDX2964175.1 HAD family acid phosphatase [Streptomyces acidiscabies]MDX3025781.1 HAD family acid phosphatase [Streptomyces acidiscabies]MDX3794157.1 HAD family acid phosphatase [Streptomyces acidiscabies]